MSRGSRMAEASARLAVAAAQGSSFCDPLVSALPVDGAAISTLVSPFEPENICASDDRAARLDQRQLDLGQGPCWRALSERHPVSVVDSAAPAPGWPLFQQAAQQEFGSMYAFPLRVGSLDIGSVDLYADSTHSLDADDLADARLLARIVAGQVLQQAVDRLTTSDADGDRQWASRRVVHQATGMVMAQFRVRADEALLIIRAHAFVLGRPVLEVSTELVARTITIPST